jgi:hypothetical protein
MRMLLKPDFYSVLAARVSDRVFYNSTIVEL